LHGVPDERRTDPLLQQVKILPDMVKMAIAQIDDVSAPMLPGQPAPLTAVMPADALSRLSRAVNFVKEIGNGILSWNGGVDKDFFFSKWKSLTVGLAKQAFEAAQSLVVADSELWIVSAQMKLYSNCIDEMNAVSASFLILIMGKPILLSTTSILNMCPRAGNLRP